MEQKLWIPPSAELSPITSSGSETVYPPVQFIPPNIPNRSSASSGPQTHTLSEPRPRNQWEAVNAVTRSPNNLQMISGRLENWQYTAPTPAQEEAGKRERARDWYDPDYPDLYVHRRPFDATISTRMLHALKTTGSTRLTAGVVNSEAEEENNAHYPGKIRSGILAIRGIGQRLNLPSARLEAAQRREHRFARREDVVRHVGNRIFNPEEYPLFPPKDPSHPNTRPDIEIVPEAHPSSVDYDPAADPKTDRTNPNYDPKEDPTHAFYYGIWSTSGPRKASWVGTNAYTDRSATWREENRHNIGFQLIPFKNVPEGRPRVNELRPTTRSEKAADRRMEHQIQKWREKRRDVNWLERSYETYLRPGMHDHLSKDERRHVGKQSRRIDKQRQRIDKIQGKFEAIQHSEDWRGSLARTRRGFAHDYERRVTDRRDRRAVLRAQVRANARIVAQNAGRNARALAYDTGYIIGQRRAIRAARRANRADEVDDDI